jgi:AraC-like DNA-binding protein
MHGRFGPPCYPLLSVMPAPTNFHHYLPVDDDAMRWGIYVTGIGRNTVPSHTNYPPATHPPLYGFRWQRGRTLPEFAVILIDRGAGVFESEATRLVSVPAPSTIFLFPGVWHRYCPRRETGWRERWLCFNGELAHRLMDIALLSRESSVRPVSDPSPLIDAFDRLLDRVHHDPTGNSILFSLHALGYLAAVIEAAAADSPQAVVPSSPHGRTAGDDVASQAMSLIWTHGHRTISVDEIAASIGVTRRTLERRFQKHVGHSVIEELIRCRLNRAKRLLEETDMPVKVVAQLSGFPSEERLRVAFLRRESTSPLRFRRRCHGKVSGP